MWVGVEWVIVDLEFIGFVGIVLGLGCFVVVMFSLGLGLFLLLVY